MDPKQANKKTIENIREYLNAKSGLPISSPKIELLEKHGFREKGDNYEAYIKLTIPKAAYNGGDVEYLKQYLIEEFQKLIKPI